MRRLLLASVSPLIVVAIAAPASATHTNQTDENDVRGLLDVSAVVFRHDSGPDEWIFKTYTSWSVKKVWDHGYFVVRLDVRGGHAIDYFAFIRSDGRSMLADLFRKRANGTEVHVRQLKAWRAGDHGAGVAVPRRALAYGANRTSFFWTTLSTFTGARCRKTCIDLVPDDGSLMEQELPTPT